MQKTRFYSYRLNNLAKGCRLCVQGKKSVFFVTGLCPRNCFYCPISEKKYRKDVTFINEWPTDDWPIIKKEIRLCRSAGVGITGGDPLVKLDRTIDYIKRLKKEFGKNFHIHLYTPLALINEESLNRLFQAGLDEIRFHPDLENRRNWKRLDLAKKFSWDAGIEIPVIPGKGSDIKDLIDYSVDLIDFLNLNEFEYSDTNAMKLTAKKFRTKDSLSYAIKGSQELAMSLLSYIEKKYPSMDVHYCTARLKDKVQMKKRIKKRAESIKKPFDTISPDGTLIRGAIYLNDHLPDKKKKIAKEKKTQILDQLKQLKKALEKDFQLSLYLDKDNLRLLTSAKDIKRLARMIHPKLFKLTIVEEYPTYDAFIVELDVLS